MLHRLVIGAIAVSIVVVLLSKLNVSAAVAVGAGAAVGTVVSVLLTPTTGKQRSTWGWALLNGVVMGAIGALLYSRLQP